MELDCYKNLMHEVFGADGEVALLLEKLSRNHWRF